MIVEDIGTHDSGHPGQGAGVSCSFIAISIGKIHSPIRGVARVTGDGLAIWNAALAAMSLRTLRYLKYLFQLKIQIQSHDAEGIFERRQVGKKLIAMKGIRTIEATSDMPIQRFKIRGFEDWHAFSKSALTIR